MRDMNPIALFCLVAAALPAFTAGGPSFIMREKRDDMAANVRAMGRLTDDLKYMSGLRKKTTPTPAPAGKRSDIDMLQTEFVSPAQTGKSPSYASSRPQDESTTVRSAGTTVVIPLPFDQGLAARSLDAGAERTTGSPSLSFVTAPAHLEIYVVNATAPQPANPLSLANLVANVSQYSQALGQQKKVVPASGGAASRSGDEATTIKSTGTTIVIPLPYDQGLPASSNASFVTAPAHVEVLVNASGSVAQPTTVLKVNAGQEPRNAGQQKKGASGKQADLDLLQTEFVTLKTVEQTVPSPEATSISSQTFAGAGTNVPLKQYDVHARTLESSGDRTSSSTPASIHHDALQPNVTVGTPASSPSSLKQSANASVNLVKEPHVVPKNKSMVNVQNTTESCPKNSTNCTLKAKKLVPIVDLVNLNDTASNKTRDNAEGGVINFLKRYFTW